MNNFQDLVEHPEKIKELPGYSYMTYSHWIDILGKPHRTFEEAMLAGLEWLNQPAGTSTEEVRTVAKSLYPTQAELLELSENVPARNVRIDRIYKLMTDSAKAGAHSCAVAILRSDYEAIQESLKSNGFSVGVCIDFEGMNGALLKIEISWGSDDE